MPDTLDTRHGALRERIVDRLRADIVEGRIPPGAQLRTEEIMARFGVSNSPLREAFAQLEAEGLVDVHRNRGAFVAPVTRVGADDLLRVGTLLWDTLYRWSIPRLNADDIADLAELVTTFETSRAAGDDIATMTAAEDFQRLLAERCGSPELLRAVGAGRVRLRRLVRMAKMHEQLDAYARLNAETLAAAREGDVERAAEALAVFGGHVVAAVDAATLDDDPAGP